MKTMKEEEKPAFILIPDSLSEGQNGYVHGFSQMGEDNLTFYITNNKLQQKANNQTTIGYLSNNALKTSNAPLPNVRWLCINSVTNQIELKNCDKQYKPIRIIYNYKTFHKSSVFSCNVKDNGEQFTTLYKAIQQDKVAKQRPNIVDKLTRYIFLMLALISGIFIKILHKINLMFKHSDTLKYLEDYLNFLNSLHKEFTKDNKLNLKVISVLTSLFLNVALAFVATCFIKSNIFDILNFLDYSMEEIIHRLKEVLSILMGSPAGLKLNYAFNHALGKFFFFHIDLWKSFIYESKQYITNVLWLFLQAKYIGLSLQIAIFLDFIAFVTFHVYCIYIYAARLYWMQVKALISLWRLFIGRKYNPLRDRVDSCVYTHHQLFIGTLGFTICLFLLPTTLLYYSVFVIFRIIILVVRSVLTALIRKVEQIPVYLSILWLFNSPCVAGSIYVSYKSVKKGKPCLYVTLKKLGYFQTIKSQIVYEPKGKSNSDESALPNVIKNAFTGQLL